MRRSIAFALALGLVFGAWVRADEDKPPKDPIKKPPRPTYGTPAKVKSVDEDKGILVVTLKGKDDKDRELKGKTITVLNLPEIPREDGWDGPGLYIIPLVKRPAGPDGATQYRVPEIPRSPGFPHGKDRTDPRIYRATDDARRQLEDIRRGHWE